MKTLRPGRRLFFLALRTLLLTCALLACLLYLAQEKASPPVDPPRQPAPEEAGNSLPAIRARAGKSRYGEDAVAAWPGAGSVEMVKSPDISRDTKTSVKRTFIPRLQTSGGDQGRWYAQVSFGPRDHPAEAAPETKRETGGDAVFIPPGAVSKKIVVRGARPVSRKDEKRYASIDAKAEQLRQKRRLEGEAEKERLGLLRHEKAVISFWLILTLAAGLIAASRVIKAWRSIHKPDGPHWTLK